MTDGVSLAVRMTRIVAPILLLAVLLLPAGTLGAAVPTHAVSAPSLVVHAPTVAPTGARGISDPALGDHVRHAGAGPVVSPYGHSTSTAHPVITPPLRTDRSSVDSTGASELAAARASLARQSHSTAQTCTPGLTSASCAPPTENVRSDANGTEFGLQLANTTGAPPANSYASLVWDAADGYVIWFGGYNTTYGLENQTWIFYNATWTNWTYLAGPAPSAREGAMFSWDDQLDADVLYGGYANNGLQNDTWWFFDLGWYNDTSSSYNAGPDGFGTMVNWDDGGLDNGTFLFGGCTSELCLSVTNVTWTYQDNVECPTSSPCWLFYSFVTPPPARAFESMSFYPYNEGGNPFDAVILYGGEVPCFLCTPTVFNDTWYFVNNTWINDTSLAQTDSFEEGGAYPPTGLYGASMFYDPLSDAMILVGGADVDGNVSSTVYGIDGVYAAFFPEDWSGPVQPSYLMSEADSVDGAPAVIFGGFNESGYSSTSLYAWEEPYTANVHVAPTTVDTGRPVNFYSNVTSGGALAWYYSGWYTNWTFGNGPQYYNTSPNATYSYPTPGTFWAQYSITDWFGVRYWTDVEITVATLGVTATATEPATDVGVADTFDATPVHGVGPFNYTWSFSGNSSQAYTASTHWTFAKAGTGWGNVTLRDSEDTNATKDVSVTVNPALGVTAAASQAAVDAGQSFKWTATPSGGTAPYNYTWLLPNGAKAYTQDVNYTGSGTGTETARVFVNDTVGGSANHSASITVNPTLAVTATVSATSAKTGSTLDFNSTVSGGTTPITTQWNFGDGGTSALGSATHAYSAAGTYTINFWANDSVGNSVHKQLSVTVTGSGGGTGPGTGTSGSGSSGLPITWIIIAVIVVIVVIALAVLMMRRGRGGSSQSPPPNYGQPPQGAPPAYGAPPQGPPGAGVPPPPGGAPPGAQ
jgi:PKD domain